MTCRTQYTVRYRVTMCSVLRTEVPTLNTTLEAFTFRLTSYVNNLTHCEQINTDRSTNFTAFKLSFSNTELFNQTTSSNTRFREVTFLSVSYARFATFTSSYLNCLITISFKCFDLRNAVWIDFDNCNRYRNTSICKDASHTTFATD